MTGGGSATCRVGVDVGGTFTDLCCFDEATGAVTVYKTPSTPEDQSLGIADGLAALLAASGRVPAEVAFLGHGTTVATNAMLEGTFARVGLITTRGFRDLLELRRQKRPSLYDLFFDKPPPLVPRHLRIEVRERLGPDGRVIEPLDEAEARAAVRALAEAGVEALAVCCLYAFLDPTHERRVVALARELALDLPVWSSAEVLPEFREYERLSTTVANACLGPVMQRYLTNFQERAGRLGVRAAPVIMQPSGGVMSVAEACARPASTLCSGPSAGVIGAAALARAAGHPNVITFDMGGTSTDVCLVEGEPRVSTDREVAGYALKVPMIDVHSIGAGGGSVAWVDPGGGLKVGPRSMGARPGPAAYGLGGTEPTVSDANVVLGRLNPRHLLGGRMPLDAAAAERAIEERVGKPLGLDLEAAALGILTVVNANMILATRLVSVERGYDPREFTLVAFGGAGPLHAAAVAAELGMPRVLIPPAPGIVCALGLLATDMRVDYVRTAIMPAAPARLAEINAIWADLEAKAAAWFVNEGITPNQQALHRTADLRYVGQNHELAVAAPPGTWDDAALGELCRRFHRAHERAYTYMRADQPVQAVSFRVTAVGVIPKIHAAPRPAGAPDASGAIAGARRVLWGDGPDPAETPVYDRARLQPGHVVRGPAVIEQLDATTVLAPGQTGSVDAYGNLLVELQ